MPYKTGGDTRMVGAHYAPSVIRALKILAAERGLTMRLLLAEAITDLFKKYGKRPPAELPKSEG